VKLGDVTDLLALCTLPTFFAESSFEDPPNLYSEKNANAAKEKRSTAFEKEMRGSPFIHSLLLFGKSIFTLVP